MKTRQACGTSIGNVRWHWEAVAQLVPERPAVGAADKVQEQSQVGQPESSFGLRNSIQNFELSGAIRRSPPVLWLKDQTA